jgi:AraC family transcriptional regulator
MASDILVKGMVCERCVSVIKEGIINLGYEVNKVSLGKISVKSDLSKEEYQRIENFLRENGFEIISSRQMRIVKQAKELINDLFAENSKYNSKLKFSSLLSEALHMNYDSISELFTELEGITPERYIITKRIEKVKEMLVYTDLRLTEIAYITGFSSINHLSRQFKELTGFSPSHFKAVRSEKKELAGQI